MTARLAAALLATLTLSTGCVDSCGRWGDVDWTDAGLVDELPGGGKYQGLGLSENDLSHGLPLAAEENRALASLAWGGKDPAVFKLNRSMYVEANLPREASPEEARRGALEFFTRVGALNASAEAWADAFVVNRSEGVPGDVGLGDAPGEYSSGIPRPSLVRYRVQLWGSITDLSELYRVVEPGSCGIEGRVSFCHAAGWRFFFLNPWKYVEGEVTLPGTDGPVTVRLEATPAQVLMSYDASRVLREDEQDAVLRETFATLGTPPPDPLPSFGDHRCHP